MPRHNGTRAAAQNNVKRFCCGLFKRKISAARRAMDRRHPAVRCDQAIEDSDDSQEQWACGSIFNSLLDRIIHAANCEE